MRIPDGSGSAPLPRPPLSRALRVAGLDKIEFLQSHENLDIYQKSFEIIENYFGSEEEDGRLAPAVSSTSGQYRFDADQAVPMGGFNF